ncbi:hypothetical protein ACIG47_04785 [Promicromonospora sp. NPDC052451]|uniref:hypothetical protein n=1 Tax=Promicromonospora sp. NPDC052451 TaxID=3364407 RepID=UPI0037C9E182
MVAGGVARPARAALVPLVLVLVVVMCVPLVVLSWWDRSDECTEAIAAHRDLLVREAARVPGSSSTPDVACDDTGGPPAYAVLELDPRSVDRIGGHLTRRGWECVASDAEDLPGVECTKLVDGVPLVLSTATFRNGTVSVWLSADRGLGRFGQP